MKGYHGTTRENALNILDGNSKGIPTWCVSDDEYLYLWCPQALIDGGECEDVEDAEFQAIQFAFESAQITAALSNDPQKEIVVLEFDFDPELIEEDESCKDMDLARRVEDFEGIEKCHTKTFVAKHNSRLDALIVSNLLDNECLNHQLIDEDLREAAQAMKDIYIDGLSEFDWREE